MKKNLFITPLITGIVLIIGLSPAMAKKKQHFLDRYDHDMHNSFFDGTVECTSCHPNDNSYSRETVKPDCHQCHNSPNAIIPATNTCTMCHNPTLKPINPRSHDALWKTKHPLVAMKDAKSCGTCHAVKFCVTCHQDRNPVKQANHRRNFRFFHSVEARANPASCDKCHAVNFCTSCHATRRIP